jgi:hypothetical protein
MAVIPAKEETMTDVSDPVLATPDPDDEIVQEFVPDAATSKALATFLPDRTHLTLFPGAEEVVAMAAQAKMMAASGLVPNALKGKPADVLLVLMTGRDLGIPPTTAIRECYVIEGNVTVSPQIRLARIRQLGLGRVLPGPANTDLEATAIALDPDGKQIGPPIRYSWHDAQRAGLVGLKCTPDEHDTTLRTGKRKDGRSRR